MLEVPQATIEVQRKHQNADHQKYVQEVLIATGVPQENAVMISHSLLQADL